MATTAFIGLGSNLGDRRAHLDSALSGLAAVPGTAIRAVSTYHESSPVGGPPGQGPFLNAAAALTTTLEPDELLARLHAVEQAEGRVRVDRWGERTVDLDLLLWGERIIRPECANRLHVRASPALVVPHPWLAFRRFVLAPLAEIGPTAVDPVTGRSIAGLLANLDRRPSSIAIDDPGKAFGNALHQQLISALGPNRQQNPSPEPGHSHWVVSNVVHDAPCAQRDGTLSEHGQRESQEHRERAPGATLTPTFVVTPALVPAYLHCGIPVLEVDEGDLAGAVATVLAACSATRS